MVYSFSFERKCEWKNCLKFHDNLWDRRDNIYEKWKRNEKWMSFFFATLFKRMVPPSKKRKIEKKEEKEIPLSSVLEWFDTTTKPSSILAREKERKVILRIKWIIYRQSLILLPIAYIQEMVVLFIYVVLQELEKLC